MTASASVEIAAPVDRVWSLLSDLSRMGEWSPETARIEWKGGATGPAVGAVFEGHNQKGKRKWSTTCSISVFEPNRELAWDVTSVGGLKVARWRYVLEPIGDGATRLSESTEDQRGRIVTFFGTLASGVKDRATHNHAGMVATLERIKAAAEA
jgi:uncharacterized protein YndB with AHSA1/START domain